MNFHGKKVRKTVQVIQIVQNTFGNPMSYGTYPDMVKPTQVSASGQIGGVMPIK